MCRPPCLFSPPNPPSCFQMLGDCMARTERAADREANDPLAQCSSAWSEFQEACGVLTIAHTHSSSASASASSASRSSSSSSTTSCASSVDVRRCRVATAALLAHGMFTANCSCDARLFPADGQALRVCAGIHTRLHSNPCVPSASTLLVHSQPSGSHSGPDTDGHQPNPNPNSNPYPNPNSRSQSEQILGPDAKQSATSATSTRNPYDRNTLALPDAGDEGPPLDWRAQSSALSPDDTPAAPSRDRDTPVREAEETASLSVRHTTARPLRRRCTRTPRIVTADASSLNSAAQSAVHLHPVLSVFFLLLVHIPLHL